MANSWFPGNKFSLPVSYLSIGSFVLMGDVALASDRRIDFSPFQIHGMCDIKYVKKEGYKLK